MKTTEEWAIKAEVMGVSSFMPSTLPKFIEMIQKDALKEFPLTSKKTTLPKGKGRRNGKPECKVSYDGKHHFDDHGQCAHCKGYRKPTK